MPKTLFHTRSESSHKHSAPLADRMRPRTLDEVVGQRDLVAPGSAFRRLVESGSLPSCIFWGPPGSGKTTLAKLLAQISGLPSCEISAVSSGLTEAREIIREAQHRLELIGKRTALFIDEIHRFNKMQQDAFLPYVERGVILLIGATTENPSFEVNAALLSRCKVCVLKPLEPEDVRFLAHRALADRERGFGTLDVSMPEDVLAHLVRAADGDARMALNVLEMLVSVAHAEQKLPPIKLSLDQLASVLQRTHLLYDKHGEEHFTLISALHKSLRGSDVHASLYWLGRMLLSGEDPLYIARRLIRFASEDIGMADPHALVQAIAGAHAARLIGMPECNVNLAQVVVYLAKAPKSHALYVATERVARDVRESPNEPVPLHLRNAPTALMKELGYGKGYQYNPDFDEPVNQAYLPNSVLGKTYLPEC